MLPVFLVTDIQKSWSFVSVVQHPLKLLCELRKL